MTKIQVECIKRGALLLSCEQQLQYIFVVLQMYRRTTKMYLPPEPEGQMTQIDAKTKRSALLLVNCFSVKYHECKMFSPVLEKKN